MLWTKAGKMFFRFSTKKTLQAVAVLLKLDRGRMGYLRLLKLLYIADRENVIRVGRPIVGTRTVAMNSGPLHSEVYNLIKGEHVDAPMWADHIRKEGYEIELLIDPGVSELSAAEVRTLTAVSEKYSSFSEWDVVEVTHDFPEWIKNAPEESANTSRTIPFEDVLDAVGLSTEKEAILAEVKEDAKIDGVFVRARAQSARARLQPS
jgi:uncharacterized phage-associated protein